MTLWHLFRRPSAFVPVALSSAALLTVLGHVALHGTAREADEGAAAHMFLLLIAAQAPILTWFAIRWLPQAPRPALGVLAMQAGAALAALAPVFYLGL